MNNLLELIRSHKMSGLSEPTFSTEKKWKMPWAINLSTQRRKKNKENQNPNQSGGHVGSSHGLFLPLVSHFSSPADRPLSPTNCREREGSGISSFPNWLSGTWSHICYLVGFCRELVFFFFFQNSYFSSRISDVSCVLPYPVASFQTWQCEITQCDNQQPVIAWNTVQLGGRDFHISFLKIVS